MLSPQLAIISSHKQDGELCHHTTIFIEEVVAFTQNFTSHPQPHPHQPIHL